MCYMYSLDISFVSFCRIQNKTVTVEWNLYILYVSVTKEYTHFLKFQYKFVNILLKAPFYNLQKIKISTEFDFNSSVHAVFCSEPW